MQPFGVLLCFLA
jgi:hypothetical protein